MSRWCSNQLSYGRIVFLSCQPVLATGTNINGVSECWQGKKDIFLS